MFKTCYTYEAASDSPFVLQVAVPNGEGRFVTYKYQFDDRGKMYEMGQAYFNQFLYDPFTILPWHERVVRDFEAQPELPFIKMNHPKSDDRY